MTAPGLHHEVTGDLRLRTPVVLLRPIAGTLALWGRFRELVAGHRPVIACEARGIGRSPPAAVPTTTRGMARDVSDLLEHLRVPSAFVFGLSLGGMVATWLAIDRADLVRGLVLASTPDHGLALAHAPGQGVRFAVCLVRGAGAREACLTERVLSAPFRRTQPERVAAILDEVRRERGSLRSLILHAAAGATHDPRAELHRVQAPSLCIAGGLDRLVGPSRARDLARGIPGASVYVIENTGHDLSLEQPDELASRVAAFLLTCERARA